MTHNPPPDFVQAMTILVSAWASVEMAHVIGTYVAIIIAATASAFFSWFSVKNDSLSVWSGIWYVVLRVILAVVVTVQLAKLIGRYEPRALPDMTLIPLALAIGQIRNFESVINFTRSRLAALIDRLLGHSNVTK